MGKDQEMKSISLGDMAEVCLGKVILKDDIVPDGNAKVASISNMTEQGMAYEEMESTNATAEDLEKYAVRNNDVLITCRGTKFRSVLVKEKPSYNVVASGNLMIIRCEKAIDAAVIHLYLQSPIGEGKIIPLFQGKSSINIGKKQLQTLQITALSEKSKEKMVQLWKQGRKKYIHTILKADQEWGETNDRVNGFFVGINEDQPPLVKKSQINRPQDRLLIELD